MAVNFAFFEILVPFDGFHQEWGYNIGLKLSIFIPKTGVKWSYLPYNKPHVFFSKFVKLI